MKYCDCGDEMCIKSWEYQEAKRSGHKQPQVDWASVGPELVNALENAVANLKVLIEGERCDHAANICWCGVDYVIQQGKAALRRVSHTDGQEGK